MIRNHKEFCDKSTVDSAAITNALAKTDNVISVLRKVQGAYVFVWYNTIEKKLYLVKNDQRPLSVLETDSEFIISSEVLLSRWIITRNNSYTTTTKQIDLKNLTLYSYDLMTKTWSEGEEYKTDIFTQTNTNIIPIGVGTINTGGVS